MALKVVWLDRAAANVRDPDMISVWEAELKAVFKGQHFTEVAVHNLFAGYSQRQNERVVLGVVTSAARDSDIAAQSHMVKLGWRSKVEKDYSGWLETIVKNNIVSRLISPVRQVALADHDGHERHAVVYQNALGFYGVEANGDLPGALEDAVLESLNTGSPACESLERLLTELFAELFRCCYRRSADRPEAAADFYKHELQSAAKSHLATQLPGYEQQSGPTVWELWQQHPTLLDLRRDALWLSSVKRPPTDTSPPQYLDPVDWFRFVLMDPAAGSEAVRIPDTLVGPGHGDLHGRNIIVGSLRGEVFQPTVIDYGDMQADGNLPVWDFVKLEMELKCRLLPSLCDSDEAREALLRCIHRGSDIAEPFRGNESHVVFPAELKKDAVRVRRLETAFLFERALVSHMALIDGRSAAFRRIATSERSPTGHAAIDRALCLLVSLRKEAAALLGFETGRAGQWNDEYLFALAAYGLLTAKWDVDSPHLAWALVSAGVSLAHLNEVTSSPTGLVARLSRPDHSPSASHFIPLARGAALNKSRQSQAAVHVLSQASEQFPLAVSLHTELALALARTGQLDAAGQAVKPFLPLCCLFGDYETVCRISRIYKDRGDQSITDPRPSHADFVERAMAGYQFYRQAFEHYLAAYRFSGHYYPGINAATLALLIDECEQSRSIAAEVLRICRTARVEPCNRMWIFATEGEAALLVGRNEDALRFYSQAFHCDAFTATAASSMEEQLKRIQWTLNAADDPVAPILERLAISVQHAT